MAADPKDEKKRNKIGVGDFIDRGAKALTELFFTGSRESLDELGNEVKEAAQEELAEKKEEEKQQGTIETDGETVEGSQ